MQGERRLEGCKREGRPGGIQGEERRHQEIAGRGKTQGVQGDGRLECYKREDAAIPETR